MSYNYFGNEFDPGLEELNELAGWVFDTDLYKVNGPSSSHISKLSSDSTIDFDFGYFNESFLGIDENELPDIVGQNEFSSSEEYDHVSEMLNEQFFWDDDSKLSEADYGKTIEQFFWEDEIVDRNTNEQFSWGDEGVEIKTNGKFFWDDEVVDRKTNEQFLWEDDIYSGDIFDLAFEKLNELFSGVDEYDDRKLYKDGYSRDDNFSWEGTPEVLGPYFGFDDEYPRNDFSPSDGKLFDDVDEINAMLRRLTCVADEPEYEEEKDLYLSCRKDAIKMDRAATSHLNEAKNSFLSGDHISAKRLSEKAKEEKKAARKLHAEAAREILRIKNKNNGIMKLDLHCLHVAEAIQAVKERLRKIEAQGVLICLDESTSGKLKQQRLEVITGRGKHSSGAPKLPGAVRSFLKKNGYQFDGNRPGVIMVQPKFRAC